MKSIRKQYLMIAYFKRLRFLTDAIERHCFVYNADVKSPTRLTQRDHILYELKELEKLHMDWWTKEEL